MKMEESQFLPFETYPMPVAIPLRPLPVAIPTRPMPPFTSMKMEEEEEEPPFPSSPIPIAIPPMPMPIAMPIAIPPMPMPIAIPPMPIAIPSPPPSPPPPPPMPIPTKMEEKMEEEEEELFDDSIKTYPIPRENAEEWIKYFDHPHHQLSLGKKNNSEIECPACGKKLDSSSHYICSDGCTYGVHKSCVELPEEVQSPFHPQHTLTLKRPRYSRQFVCKGCNLLSNGFCYHCSDCNFQLDRECAFVWLVTKQMQRRTHPHHKHQFQLFEKVPKKRYNCAVCLKYCSDPLPTYGCLQCLLFLHGSCFDERKFPPEIQHYYHPHPLTLSIKSHRKLILSSQTATTSHPKLTLPTTSSPSKTTTPPPKLTLPTTSSPPRTTTLPPKFTTPSPRNFTCKACHKSAEEIHWCYSCKQCQDFGMDIACTTLLVLPTSTTIKSETESQIQHFLHGHPLSLRYKDINDQQVASCRVCMKSCSGPTYVCGRPSSDYCENIHFHKSCLEFQQQICHSFHPYHLLTLLDQSNSNGSCNACRNSSNPKSQIFNYICESHNCRFLLHAECSTVMVPAIKYQGHDHLLRFLDNDVENIKLMCSACKSNICEPYAFTCLHCDLNLHLTCGPLPYIIKHEDHNTHPLFLANSPVQEEVEDETEEFYCHACEEERDPQLPVYYCAKCYFVVEIKCVFSQIISSLKGEYGDVELRSTLGHSGRLICKNKAKEMVQKKEQVKTTLTLYDNLKSWSRDEIEQLNSVLRVVEMKKVIAKEDDRDEDSEFEAFLHHDKNYTQFTKVINRVVKIPAPFMRVQNVPEIDSEWAPKEEVASVGDYMIIRRLAPILEHLLSKHGDISAMSMLRPKVKMYLFNMLCESIYSMINTKIVDVTEDLLLNWWTRLRILQFAEFKIQFAFDHLKRVVQAYLGLHVEKEEDDAVDKINRDILALQEKLKCIIAAKSARSSLTEEHLREASILKNWKAGTLFLYNK